MTSISSVIAVVDDDTRLLESLSDLLDSAGYSVRTFQSARDLLSQDPPTFVLVITDIGMPDVDGFALREMLRQSHPAIPVFLMTGRDAVDDPGPTGTFKSFFRKPFDAGALLSSIKQALHDPNVEGDHEN